MKLKINKRLSLIFLLLAISSVKSAISEDVETKEEHKLKIDYVKKTCAFLEESTDFSTKNSCFNIVDKLYHLTKDKTFLYCIAEHYIRGYGVNQNLKKGLELMEELANSNHKYSLQAQETLGIYYDSYDSPETVKDHVKGEYWTKKAADHGSSLAQHRYAHILKSKGKINDAIYWYKKAAFNGRLEAKHALAKLFREGHSIHLKKEQIYKFLHEAAKNDYAPAFQELSLLYKKDGDCEKAEFWFNKFTNSNFFKKVLSGMNPNDAINETLREQQKKAYINETKKEMEEIEKQIKPNEEKNDQTSSS